jgi:hypothetical protein
MQKPLPSEYNPYFQHYIDLTGDGDFFELFKKNTTETILFFENIPVEKHDYRYAEGKWTTKEVLQHIIDTDRIFSFRALVAARGDSEMPLNRVDENLFAKNVDVSNRSIESLLKEFTLVRNSTEMFLANINDAQSKFPANAVTYKITARACGYIIMGHALHHIQVLKERYL